MLHIIDTSLEAEQAFYDAGCINWNLFLEWIEEETEDILNEFEISNQEDIQTFCFESWTLPITSSEQ